MEELKKLLKQNFQVGDEELALFLELFSERQYAKHEYFARSGEYAHSMSFVISGVLRAYFQNAVGEEYNKTFFKTSV